MSYASNRVQSWSRLRDSWCTTRDIIMFYTPHDHRVANCNRHIAYCEAMIAFWQQGSGRGSCGGTIRRSRSGKWIPRASLQRR